MVIRNTFIIFLVSGFWHGANWTFIVWGFLHAIFFLPLLLTNNNRRNLDVVALNSFLSSVKDVISILITFLLTTLAWIFFRADNVSQAFAIFSEIASPSLFQLPELFPMFTFCLIGLFLIIEWTGRTEDFGLERISNYSPKPIRWAIYMILITSLFLSNTAEQEFIYFQF